jgi:hypothetical protein
MAKAGLEQCAISVNTGDTHNHTKMATIWVKECKELLELTKENHE